MPYRGPLSAVAHQLVGGLHQSMFYVGARTIPQLQSRGTVRPDHAGRAQGVPPARHPDDRRGAQLHQPLTPRPAQQEEIARERHRDRPGQARPGRAVLRRHRRRAEPAHPRPGAGQHRLADRRLPVRHPDRRRRRWTRSSPPQTAIEVGRLGGLGVLNLEGLWTRYEDPAAALDGDRRAARVPGDRPDAAALRRARAPGPGGQARIGQLREAGSRRRAARCRPTGCPSSPRSCCGRASTCSSSAARRCRPSTSATDDEALNLKEFIYTLDAPVIVGGVATYRAALHLMRAGAAGVLVGFGGGAAHTTARRPGRARADGHRRRRRGRRPPGLHGRVGRALRARHRRRGDEPQRRHRQGHRVRRRRGHGGLAAGPGDRGPRARVALGHGGGAPRAAPRGAALGRARSVRWPRSCTGRAGGRTAR